jgi:hypothetical protein
VDNFIVRQAEFPGEETCPPFVGTHLCRLQPVSFGQNTLIRLALLSLTYAYGGTASWAQVV